MNTNSDSIKKFIRCESCHAILPICTGELIEVNGQPARVCSSCFRKLTDKRESLYEVMPSDASVSKHLDEATHETVLPERYFQPRYQMLEESVGSIVNKMIADERGIAELEKRLKKIRDKKTLLG